MTLRIGEITTEVVATPAPAPAPATEAREGMDWQERVKVEAIHALIRRDELRTRAHGYDD